MTNNGWSAVTEAGVTRVYIASDVDGCTFRSGDVAKAFIWLFEQIDARVERVTMLNGWRSVADNIKYRGDPGSNHLSGTAGDVNGFMHPYEHLLPVSQRYGNYDSGWTNAQARTIRAIQAESGGLFFWGIDYPSGWRDAMHFDLKEGTTAADVAAFIRAVEPPPIEEDQDMRIIQRGGPNGTAYVYGAGWGRALNVAEKEAFMAAGEPFTQLPATQYDLIVRATGGGEFSADLRTVVRAEVAAILAQVNLVEGRTTLFLDAKSSAILAQATAAANKPAGIATVTPETEQAIAKATRDEFTTRPLK